jgi:DNA segregation ATPase FtsK/SpoIIIE, S-DNA-T family
MARTRNRKTKPSPRKASRRKSPRSAARTREIGGIAGLGVAIFLLASLLSLQIGDGGLMGPLGRASALWVYGALGLCGYLAVLAFGGIAVRLLMGRQPAVSTTEAVAFLLALPALAAIAHLAGASYRVADIPPGGGYGAYMGELLRGLVSTAGTILLALIALVIAAVIATPLRIKQVADAMWAVLQAGGRAVARAAAEVGRFCGEVIRAILPERDRDEYLDDEDDEYLDDDDDEWLEDADDPPIIAPGSERVDDAAPAAVMEGDTEKLADDQIDQIMEEAGSRKARGSQGKPKKSSKKKAAVAAPEPEAPEPIEAVEPSEPSAVAAAAEDEGDVDDEPEAKPAPAPAPKIVESKFMRAQKSEREVEKAADEERLDFIPLSGDSYKLPPINLLHYDEHQAAAIDRQAMLEQSAKLTQTLENYGVKGQVTAIRPGPVVTMYEFSPAPGTRINKIVNLTDDLAMALEALRVRIVAPIPGKAAVGIEVPNRTRETVYLKEIIADDAFHKAKHKLPLAIGKDIEGAPSVVDLAKMPHLLVAGTTGSGKSVAINSMITSLLYHATPEEVRMIMVDPKMLELSIYEGIPHLLLPVVTDPKKANLALRWAVEEMERRYELLAGMGVRDIASYNRKAEKLQATFEDDKARRMAEAEAAQAEADDEAFDSAVDQTQVLEHPEGDLQTPPSKLPFIVVIIDEFADLMMCAPKEVETSVARIAQKARAAGIHLILATQRPSVDVITGLIKANFPSRCAFHVTSKVDSRTVLDQGGAEALLGLGDMLFSDRGSAPKRYHGCFVDEDEVHEVVAFLKAQGRPVYNLEILKPREEEESDGGGGDEPTDEMYDRAVALVAETRQASISMIQRRLRVGYNRAARMVEQMEREGVVGPPDGTNKREVLITAA